MVIENNKINNNMDKLNQNILDHIFRYRISTAGIIQKLFFKDLTIQDVKKHLKELKHTGYIGNAQLTPYEYYYFLTEKTAQSLYSKTGKQFAGYLSDHYLGKTYAMLMFCCNGENKRQKFTFDEIQSSFFYADRIGTNKYYSEIIDGKEMIGEIKIDRGFNYRRVDQRLGSIINKKLKYDNWQLIIHEGHFMISIITPWEKKAEKLREGIISARKQKKFAMNLPIQINVCLIKPLQNLI